MDCQILVHWIRWTPIGQTTRDGEKMKMSDFDLQMQTYIRDKKYDDAERFMLERYAQVKANGTPTELRDILDQAAMFYRLPFKRNLAMAEHYYHEMEAIFPGWETDLRVTSFYFYRLRDFAKTIDRVTAMAARKDSDKEPVQFLYSALSLKGLALIYLNRFEEAVLVLRELDRIISSTPNQVPYGDEFNFLSAMMDANIDPKGCKDLAAVIVNRVRDKEFKDKYRAILDRK
jgi:hypothetical protein